MTVQIFNAKLLPPSARKPGLIKKACLTTLKSERRGAAGEINVIFLDRRRMRAMNQRFLKHDYDTDVIAFPFSSPPAFGDIYISVSQAKVQATELEHPLLREILTLAIHGTLHPLGYDDKTKSKKAVMFRKQDSILEKIPRAGTR